MVSGRVRKRKMIIPSDKLLFPSSLRFPSLANNHILDWGYAGLKETLETLREAGSSDDNQKFQGEYGIQRRCNLDGRDLQSRRGTLRHPLTSSLPFFSREISTSPPFLINRPSVSLIRGRKGNPIFHERGTGDA
jgi:hypothetical protein